MVLLKLLDVLGTEKPKSIVFSPCKNQINLDTLPVIIIVYYYLYTVSSFGLLYYLSAQSNVSWSFVFPAT